MNQQQGNQQLINFEVHNDIPCTRATVIVLLNEILRRIIVALTTPPSTKILPYINRNGGSLRRTLTTTNQIFRHVGVTRALKTALSLLASGNEMTQRDFFYQNEMR
jgi:hypothetical protein